jgi:hypothetical protein
MPPLPKGAVVLSVAEIERGMVKQQQQQQQQQQQVEPAAAATANSDGQGEGGKQEEDAAAAAKRTCCVVLVYACLRGTCRSHWGRGRILLFFRRCLKINPSANPTTPSNKSIRHTHIHTCFHINIQGCAAPVQSSGGGSAKRPKQQRQPPQPQSQAGKGRRMGMMT